MSLKPQTLTEAVNLGKVKTEQAHLLGQVAGINKAIRVLNRMMMHTKSSNEIARINAAIDTLMEESRLLLKEAEVLTPHEQIDKPVTEEEKQQLLNKQ